MASPAMCFFLLMALHVFNSQVLWCHAMCRVMRSQARRWCGVDIPPPLGWQRWGQISIATGQTKTRHSGKLTGSNWQIEWYVCLKICISNFLWNMVMFQLTMFGVPEGMQHFLLGIGITVLIERMFPPAALFIAHDALSCDELLSFWGFNPPPI